MTVEQAKEFLRSKGYFFSLWHIDDIKEICPDISDEEAAKVARLIERRHDANEGINWIVLMLAVEEVQNENNQ